MHNCTNLRIFRVIFCTSYNSLRSVKYIVKKKRMKLLCGFSCRLKGSGGGRPRAKGGGRAPSVNQPSPERLQFSFSSTSEHFVVPQTLSSHTHARTRARDFHPPFRATIPFPNQCPGLFIFREGVL
jgi:hypothetical protein